MLCEKCKEAKAVVRKELYYPASSSQKNLCATCAKVVAVKPFSLRELHNIRSYFARYTLLTICLLPEEIHFHGVIKDIRVSYTCEADKVAFQGLLKRSKVFRAAVASVGDLGCSLT